MANKTSGKPQPKEASSLRSRTSTWFECKVRYMKTMEDGSEKTVTELTP